ncbi:MAG: YceD family protein [Myxococcota bacterium]|nr:YceD family protein [Myxococcota bacterium]
MDQLKEAPEAFRYPVERDWWAEHFADVEASGAQLVGEPEIRLAARVAAENVHIEGDLEGILDAECARCAKRYRHALQDSFQLVLAPLDEEVGPSDEEGRAALERSGMCLGEDLESGWYRGGEIDLGDFLTEVVSLSIPIQPLCRDDCPGLCPICGIDRTEKNCICEEETKPASPFAALAVLKEKREGSS